MSPSGSTYLNRMEWGMRGAFLVGPSFNGIEGTLVAEAWEPIYFEILEVTGTTFHRITPSLMVVCSFVTNVVVFLFLRMMTVSTIYSILILI